MTSTSETASFDATLREIDTELLRHTGDDTCACGNPGLAGEHRLSILATVVRASRSEALDAIAVWVTERAQNLEAGPVPVPAANPVLRGQIRTARAIADGVTDVARIQRGA